VPQSKSIGNTSPVDDGLVEGNRGDPLLTIVIPTYNERENLPVLLERLEKSLRGIPFEAIVVDDNSPDGTWRLAEELARERYPWLRVVRRVNERGLGSAIIRGLREARGRYVAVIDADLQHPPELLPTMLKTALETGADVVIASRYVRGGGVEGWSRYRLLVSKAAGLVARLLLPEVRRIRDPMSGYWLVRRDIIEGVELEPRSWKILLEILVKARPRKVVEVPYVFRERLRGESKLRLRHMVEYLLHVLHLSNYRVLKFAGVGATGTIVNLAVLKALVEGLHVPLYIAYLASFEASLTWNYTLHDRITFKGRRPRGFANAVRYWARYHKAALGGLATYYTLSMLLSAAGVYYLLAALIGIVAGFAVNYLVSEHHVWS